MARILHLIGQLMRGGAERQLLHLTAALKERGWKQAILTFNPGDEWDHKVDELGIPLLSIPRGRAKALRLFRLWQTIRAEQPDLLHAWSEHANIYLSHIPGIPSARKIYSLRGDPSMNRYSGEPRAEIPYGRIYSGSASVISNSQYSLDRLNAFGWRPARSVVVGNIVEAQGRGNPEEPAQRVRIAAAGLLKPLKAYDVLLEALAIAARDGCDFELQLAGEGAERSALESQAARLGIADRVVLLGSIPDVPALMASCHLGVHPSRSEGLPNTVLEAMAEGLPTIATAVGATPALIEDGVSGLLVQPGDVEQLANALTRLITNPAERKRLGDNALERVRRDCSTAAVTDQYEALYQEILGCRVAARSGTVAEPC